MESPRTWIRRQLGLLRWRQKARSKHTVGLRVTDVPQLFERLEESGIRAAVLRWFDEVPSKSEERAGGPDVDMLIDGSGVDQTVRIALDQPGCVKCDLYSATGVRGTTYRGIPYYPPALAERILADRVRHPRGFLVPSPKMHVVSLAYHLCYHKGVEAGIESGCCLKVEPNPRRDYGELFARVAEECGEAIQKPVTLLGLHQYLRRQGWDIPLDLLPRWPKPTAWHSWLHEAEAQQLKPWGEKLPHLLVFFIREDAVQAGLTEAACDLLSEKFTVLDMQELDAEAVDRVTRRVRGGNWVEHNRSVLVPPRFAVICYDMHPAPVPATCTVGKKRKSTAAAYPLVTNGNVFFKHEVRERLNAVRPGAKKIHGIHGSDNALESQYMLRAIFGPATEATNKLLLERLEGAGDSRQWAA